MAEAEKRINAAKLPGRSDVIEAAAANVEAARHALEETEKNLGKRKVFAPATGVLVFERELGDQVQAGECFARIVAVPGDPSSEHRLVAPQSGLMVTRHGDRLIQAGAIAAKFTGSEASSTWTSGALDP